MAGIIATLEHASQHPYTSEYPDHHVWANLLLEAGQYCCEDGDDDVAAAAERFPDDRRGAARACLAAGKPVTLRFGRARYMAELPKNLRELIKAGGVEALVRAAGEQAMRREREFWLPVLERYKLPEDADIFDQLILQGYIASLRRRLGIKPDIDTIRAQIRERVRKHRQRARAGASRQLKPAP